MAADLEELHIPIPPLTVYVLGASPDVMALIASFEAADLPLTLSACRFEWFAHETACFAQWLPGASAGLDALLPDQRAAYVSIKMSLDEAADRGDALLRDFYIDAAKRRKRERALQTHNQVALFPSDPIPSVRAKRKRGI